MGQLQEKSLTQGHTNRSLSVIVTSEAPAVISEMEWQRWFDGWKVAIPTGLSPIEAYEVGLTLTDDAAIARLNQAYRQQDKPTDVLAFAAIEETAPDIPELLAAEPFYLGDIVISVETARQQAIEAGQSLTEELVWLASHGFLHLLGWDHPDDESLMKMLARQRELVATFPVANRKSS